MCCTESHKRCGLSGWHRDVRNHRGAFEHVIHCVQLIGESGSVSPPRRQMPVHGVSSVLKRGFLHWCIHEKSWVLWFQRLKDRFVLPTFRSKYSDLLQGEVSIGQHNPKFWPRGYNWSDKAGQVCVNLNSYPLHQGKQNILCLRWMSRMKSLNGDSSSSKRAGIGKVVSRPLGVSWMKSLAWMYMWWPGIDTDIEHSVHACLECQASRSVSPSLDTFHCTQGVGLHVIGLDFTLTMQLAHSKNTSFWW